MEAEMLIDSSTVKVGNQKLFFVTTQSNGNSLAIADLATGIVGEVYQGSSYISNNDISPSGSKIMWTEDHKLKEMMIEPTEPIQAIQSSNDMGAEQSLASQAEPEPIG